MSLLLYLVLLSYFHLELLLIGFFVHHRLKKLLVLVLNKGKLLFQQMLNLVNFILSFDKGRKVRPYVLDLDDLTRNEDRGYQA